MTSARSDFRPFFQSCYALRGFFATISPEIARVAQVLIGKKREVGSVRRVRISSLLYQSVLLVFIASSLYFLVWSEFGLSRHYVANQGLRRSKLRFLVLKREVAGLEREIVAWKTDPFYLEKVAREELGMGYRDEVVYLCPPEGLCRPESRKA